MTVAEHIRAKSKEHILTLIDRVLERDTFSGKEVGLPETPRGFEYWKAVRQYIDDIYDWKDYKILSSKQKDWLDYICINLCSYDSSVFIDDTWKGRPMTDEEFDNVLKRLGLNRDDVT